MKEVVLDKPESESDGIVEYNTFDKKNIYFDILKHKEELIKYEEKLKDFYKKLDLKRSHE